MQTPAWKDIVRELMAQGVTQAQQAKHAGLKPSSIGDIATGRSNEPSGWAAVRLYFLYRAGKKRVADRAARRQTG